MWILQWCFSVSVIHLTVSQVLLPPNLVINPQKLVLFKNENLPPLLEIKCEAVSMPLPWYEWTKDDVTIVINGDTTKYELKDGNLVIKNPTKQDEGMYQCFAENDYGKTMSYYAEVRQIFLEQASNPIDVPWHPDVAAGQPMRLPCKAPKSYPKAKNYWTLVHSTATDREPKKVITNKRVSVSDEGDLLFAYTVPQDAEGSDGSDGGWYYICHTFNSKTFEISLSSPVRVRITGDDPENVPAASLWQTSTPVKAIIGRQLNLRCLFSGKPVPAVSFSRPDGLIIDSRRVSHQVQDYYRTLIITNVQEVDGGTWICKASGSAVQQTFQVNVESTPIWIKKMESKNVTVGSTAVFPCEAKGVPEVQIEFYKNSEKVTENEQSKAITFNNVQKPGDLRVVQCKVWNAHGYEYAAAYLNVLEPVIILKKPEQSYLIKDEDSDKTVRMVCQASSDPSDPIQYRWLKDKMPLRELLPGYSLVSPPGGQSELTIDTTKVENDKSSSELYGGIYTCVMETQYNKFRQEVTSELKFFGDPGSDKQNVTPAGSRYWWIGLIVAGIVLVIIIVFVIYIVWRWKAQTYPVGKKEREAGYDPEDSGFHDYTRHSQEPDGSVPSSLNDSFVSDYKPAFEFDTDSLEDYGDIDTGKFNEDGSFIGAYGEKNKQEDKEEDVSKVLQQGQETII